MRSFLQRCFAVFLFLLLTHDYCKAEKIIPEDPFGIERGVLQFDKGSYAHDVIVQTDGSIVATGVVGDHSTEEKIFVIRYTANSNGYTLDKTFGDDDGAGKKKGWLTFAKNKFNRGYALAVDYSSSFPEYVITGYSSSTNESNFKLLVARIDNNGQLKAGPNTFSLQGYDSVRGTSILIDKKQRVLIAGTAIIGNSDWDICVWRFPKTLIKPTIEKGHTDKNINSLTGNISINLNQTANDPYVFYVIGRAHDGKDWDLILGKYQTTKNGKDFTLIKEIREIPKPAAKSNDRGWDVIWHNNEIIATGFKGNNLYNFRYNEDLIAKTPPFKKIDHQGRSVGRGSVIVNSNLFSVGHQSDKNGSENSRDIVCAVYDIPSGKKIYEKGVDISGGDLSASVATGPRFKGSMDQVCVSVGRSRHTNNKEFVMNVVVYHPNGKIYKQWVVEVSF